MNRDIYHIASDYFSGRISENDRKFLFQWLNESLENKAIFAEIEKVWKLTSSPDTTSEPDINVEWDRFLRLREKPGKSVSLDDKPHRLLLFYAYRIAAIIIPAILVISAILFISKRNQNQIVENTWLTVKTGNKTMVHILPDGTEVYINKISTLSYPKKFNKKERLVKLSGEAFFKVKKLGTSFIVDAGNSSIKVLGTQFNIRNYNSSVAEVIVNEGSVLFFETHYNQNNSVLKSGEMGTFKGHTIPIETCKINTGNTLSWMTQKLNFENLALKNVKQDISKYFNKVLILPHSLNNCRFTGQFNNPEITNVMNVISLSVGALYKITNDTIYFEGMGCD